MTKVMLVGILVLAEPILLHLFLLFSGYAYWGSGSGTTLGAIETFDNGWPEGISPPSGGGGNGRRSLYRKHNFPNNRSNNNIYYHLRLSNWNTEGILEWTTAILRYNI